MSQTLASVFKLTDQYTATMQKIIQSSDAYEKKQQSAQKATSQFKSNLNGMKNSSMTATSGIGMVTAKIGGLASVAYLAKKGLDLMFMSIKSGAQQQVQLNTFQALVGNDKAGTALYDYVGAYAKKSALGKTDLANATTSFLAYTRNIEQIEKLNKLTERLYAKDPTQGAQGAVFALKEVLAGDTMSIKDRFNMSGISGAKIRDLTNSGDIEGTISYLDQVFNKFGASQEVVDKNFTSLMTQVSMFKSNMRDAMGNGANPAVQNLSILMQQLNSDMAAGKFQPFFDVVANGAIGLANAVSFLAKNASIVAPILGGIVAAIVTYNTAQLLAATISTFAGTAVAAASGNWVKAATLIAGAAATIGISASLASQNKKLKEPSKTPEQAKQDFSKTMKDGKVPTEITNTAPISVKGQVDIEQESIKYMMDMAGQKFFATYSNNTLAPQVTVQNMNVSKEIDADSILEHVANGLAQATSIAPQGAY